MEGDGFEMALGGPYSAAAAASVTNSPLDCLLSERSESKDLI